MNDEDLAEMLAQLDASFELNDNSLPDALKTLTHFQNGGTAKQVTLVGAQPCI